MPVGRAAAKKGDLVTAVDLHIVLVGPAATPTPIQIPFNGQINKQLSGNVNIMGVPAATKDSTADNQPQHIPAPGASFQKAPSNLASMVTASSTVNINGKPVIRDGD